MTRYDGRKSRRIYMRKPAPAVLSNRRVAIHDLSATGFGITHDFPLDQGVLAVLEFRWGEMFALRCVVVRSVRVGDIYRTGLLIDQSPRAYQRRIQDAVAEKVAGEAALPSFFSAVADT